MDQIKLQALSNIQIFQDLTEQEMEEMDRATTMSTCEPGRVFYGPDERGEVLFLLKKGRVQLYRLSPEGKKLVVTVLDEGAIFGEMSMIGQGMHNTFAEAIDDCLLCVMSRTDVERIIDKNPMVAIRFMESMAIRLKQAEAKLEDLAFKSIPARLAALLQELSGSGDRGNMIQGYTHQDLAEMLGTYRETTTQTLNEFKSRSWIDISRKQITILDPDALASQAGA
jgi:CRP-like cAMP-binding protein